jgi:hypothetical protein
MTILHIFQQLKVKECRKPHRKSMFRVGSLNPEVNNVVLRVKDELFISAFLKPVQQNNSLLLI